MIQYRAPGGYDSTHIYNYPYEGPMPYAGPRSYIVGFRYCAGVPVITYTYTSFYMCVYI
jgi:hypothetical protein